MSTSKRKRPRAAPQARPIFQKRQILPGKGLWIALLGTLSLGLFADVLFAPGHPVLSSRDTDLFMEYLDWLTFGFGELRRGNLALWNPYLFSGAPFFGGFQSALLYPLNALFLILPIDRAINWSIALHCFLGGAFTWMWAARRGFHPAAGLLAAVIYMCCGANFLHVYAGHFPILCSLAWPPLLFLAIDGTLESPSLGWSLTGAGAAAMELLAGGPQYVFYTAVAAAVYCGLRVYLLTREGASAASVGRRLAGLFVIVVGALGLSAVQLLTSVPEWNEMVRSGGAPYEFAASYSFPPENFLTLLSPHVFGDIKSVPYWGRADLWETCLFIGEAGLVLAIGGVLWGERSRRWIWAVMVAVLLLLALGGHTPLFGLLYRHVPGFNRFRGNSKFIFLASLFLAMLAASGFDALVRGRKPGRGFAAGILGVALTFVVAAVAIGSSNLDVSPTGWWHSLVQAERATGESFLAPTLPDAPAFLAQSAGMAMTGLLVSGGTLLVVAALLFICRIRRSAVWMLLGLAVCELALFARTSIDRFDLADHAEPQLQEFLESHPGDYRILNLATRQDAALSLRAHDMWGYNPGVPKRYSQLLGFNQGVDPDQATEYVPFAREDPVWGMFRCRFVLVPKDGQITVQERSGDVLPHVLLVGRYRVLADRHALLSAVASDSFRPREEVLLESAPDLDIAPAADQGSVRIVEASSDRSSDQLTIEADVKAPAILLVTDSYASGWRARALPGSAQSSYRVMPGDYALRAIPLTAGRHRLRLEYLPLGFQIGRWISIGSWLVFVGLAGVAVLFRFR